MSEDREIRPGWLPPKAPPLAPWSAPQAPPRPRFVTAGPRLEPGAAQPSSPLAVIAIVMSVLSLVLLVLSVGVAWGVSSLMSVLALGLALTARQRLRGGLPGRETQVRTAFVFSLVGLVVAAIAAAIWLGLQSNGITPQDLQDWLERELERRRVRSSD